MPRVLVVAGSPSPASRSGALADAVTARLRGRGHAVQGLALRTLPPDALLAQDAGAPALAESLAALEASRGLVLVSPVYKAAYSGLLKAWLDALPQHALAGKTVLPLMTAGSTAHALAIDYALRPVLMTMSPACVLPGWLFAEASLEPGGALVADAEARLDALVASLDAALRLEAP